MSQEQHVSQSYRLMILLMFVGTFIGGLNQTIIGPALPSIMANMKITASTGQWLTTIFLLVNGVMIPCTAYLMARFKTRALYLMAMSIFTAGTLLAGLSHQFFPLLIARIMQAIGYGVLMPLLSSTVLMVVPAEQRGKAMGMVGLIFSVTPAIGPSIAGLVIDHFSWNAAFLVLMPFLIVDLAVSFFVMPNEGETSHLPLDKTSVVMSSIGFGGLLYAFSSVGSHGWGSMHVIAPMLIGTVVVYFFVKRQNKLDVPLLRFDCLKNRRFFIGLVFIMINNASLLFSAVMSPIFFQEIRGYSAFVAALLMLPAGICGAFMSPIAGNLYDRLGGRFVILSGLGVFMLGSFMHVFFTLDQSVPYMVVAYAIRVIGINMLLMPINTWSMTDFNGADVPHANAVINTMRQVAGSIGTAIFISIYTITQKSVDLPYLEASALGVQISYLVSSIITLILIVVGYFTIDYKGRKKRA